MANSAGVANVNEFEGSDAEKMDENYDYVPPILMHHRKVIATPSRQLS